MKEKPGQRVLILPTHVKNSKFYRSLCYGYSRTYTTTKSECCVSYQNKSKKQFIEIYEIFTKSNHRLTNFAGRNLTDHNRAIIFLGFGKLAKFYCISEEQLVKLILDTKYLCQTIPQNTRNMSVIRNDSGQSVVRRFLVKFYVCKNEN